MNWLKKFPNSRIPEFPNSRTPELPNSRRAASGLEWTLWRKLPLIAAVGTLLPLLVLGLVDLFNDPAAGADRSRWEQLVGYMVLGAILFHWFMLVTVAVGCVIVMIMKGPGDVADGLWVSHSDRPGDHMESAEEAASRRPPPSD